jgi:hypothetical protein
LEQHGAVEQRPSNVRGIGGCNTHEQRRSVFQFRGNPDQFGSAPLHESTVHQQIAGQIAHQGEFGGDCQIRTQFPGPPGARDNQCGIATEVPGRGIDLKERNSQKTVYQAMVATSVRLKSLPLNRSGSPRAFASAYEKQSPKFSPAGSRPFP